jgi:thioredoxin-like negative regulator of GroEL
VAKVDTDKSPAISQRYNIRGIPFFGLFTRGHMIRQAVGAVGKKGLIELVGQGYTGQVTPHGRLDQ